MLRSAALQGLHEQEQGRPALTRKRRPPARLSLPKTRRQRRRNRGGSWGRRESRIGRLPPCGRPPGGAAGTTGGVPAALSSAAAAAPAAVPGQAAGQAEDRAAAGRLGRAVGQRQPHRARMWSDARERRLQSTAAGPRQSCFLSSTPCAAMLAGAAAATHLTCASVLAPAIFSASALRLWKAL